MVKELFVRHIFGWFLWAGVFLMVMELLIGAEKMIRKTSGGYKVVSKTGTNLGGPYSNKKKARRRLRQVEYYKNRGK